MLVVLSRRGREVASSGGGGSSCKEKRKEGEAVKGSRLQERWSSREERNKTKVGQETNAGQAYTGQATTGLAVQG
ncbi:hypothetical protein Droror1_Dr00024172 [Drosera rotundifolia]